MQLSVADVLWGNWSGGRLCAKRRESVMLKDMCEDSGFWLLPQSLPRQEKGGVWVASVVSRLLTETRRLL